MAKNGQAKVLPNQELSAVLILSVSVFTCNELRISTVRYMYMSCAQYISIFCLL